MKNRIDYAGDDLLQGRRTLMPGMLISRLVLCLALMVASSGCVALAVGATGGAAGAVYVMGKFKEEINHSVPAVHEATLAGLQDLDLPVLEDKADKLTAHIESKFADDTRVWIDLDSVAESRTRLTIRVGVMGDEGRSRRIVDAIQKHLA